MSQQCYYRNSRMKKKSLTDANSSRKFLTCVNGGCNYFRWAKAEFDPRSKAVINSLKGV